MAKPVLVIKFPETATKQSITVTKNYVLDSIREDYHVIVAPVNKEETITFECFNDCSGLDDKDITVLIEEMKQLLLKAKE